MKQKLLIALICLVIGFGSGFLAGFDRMKGLADAQFQIIAKKSGGSISQSSFFEDFKWSFKYNEVADK